MPITLVDKRLLIGLEDARLVCRSLELTGDARVIADVAYRLLDDSHTALEAAIRAEDAAETDLLEARAALPRVRAHVDEAYARLHAALRAGALERRLRGGNDDTRDLLHYLGMRPSAFARIGFSNAVDTLERGRRFADRFVPERFRADVLPFADAAFTEGDRLRTRLGQASADVLQANGALERARAAARDHYLSARDLMSAALRLASMRGRLDQLLPPLKRLLGLRSPPQPA